MCDLLGMSFNMSVGARISLDMFQERGKENPDGWGLAFYKGMQLQLVKEAQPAVKSPLFDFVESYPESKTFISHVRRSTMGTRSYANTHPFYRVVTIDKNRSEYSFAHNGTLTDMGMLKLSTLKPIGETDSEHLMCYLLEGLVDNGFSGFPPEAFKLIEGKLRQINTVENTLNCILSDGEYILCYSDENLHNGGLRYAEQKQPFSSVDLIDEDTTLGFVNLSANIEGDEEGPSGYVVVTRALSGNEWIEFKPGELIVFRHGHIVYPDSRVTQG
ncbi:MAG: class II glutamine amidotransferase [Candidatus Thorarchaeota archaeon]|jgi:glutamine amidotransferase